MSAQSPDETGADLPTVDDLPRVRRGGLDPAAVERALEAHRRAAARMKAELRVLKANSEQLAPSVPQPVGHAARMNAMRILRAAAEFADTIEREAEKAASSRLAQIDEELEYRRRNVVEAEESLERARRELEERRGELLEGARVEAQQLVANAQDRAAALREKAREDATQLTTKVQSEVEETIAWAREEAATILTRVQEVSRQLLHAASLGPERVEQVSEAIARAARAANEASRGPVPPLAAPLYDEVDGLHEQQPRPVDRRALPVSDLNAS